MFGDANLGSVSHGKTTETLDISGPPIRSLLEVSIIETKHLMEISDFDQDGVLSKHLGSVDLRPRPMLVDVFRFA